MSFTFCPFSISYSPFHRCIYVCSGNVARSGCNAGICSKFSSFLSLILQCEIFDQINAGLDFLFDIESNTSTQIILIWIITLIATVSVTTGVDKGIKYLSQINFGISCFVLLWLFFAGDSFFLLNLFTEIFGHHFQVNMYIHTLIVNLNIDNGQIELILYMMTVSMTLSI